MNTRLSSTRVASCRRDIGSSLTFFISRDRAPRGFTGLISHNHPLFCPPEHQSAEFQSADQGEMGETTIRKPMRAHWLFGLFPSR
jgi:hypothetical protein